MHKINAIRGGLYGLLIGDAAGVPYEFHAPSQIPAKHLIEMTPPDDFDRSHPSVAVGTWSDDGSQALCLLASLLENQAVDAEDLMQKFADWYIEGYLAINRKTFDCGVQTADAIRKYVLHQLPANSVANDDEYSNGNSSLMRVLPLVLWHNGSDDDLIADAFAQSHITHAHLRAKLCCALYCLWAKYVLHGDDIKTSYQRAVDFLYKKYANNAPYLNELNQHIKPFDFSEVTGSGYVVDCLKTAYVALQEPTFKAVIQRAIQFGNDTDTTACVAGGIAGLYFGFDGIDQDWVQTLLGKEIVDEMLAQLFATRT